MQLLMTLRLSQKTDRRQVYSSLGKHNYKLHPHHKPWKALTVSLQFPRHGGLTAISFPMQKGRGGEKNHCQRNSDRSSEK